MQQVGIVISGMLAFVKQILLSACKQRAVSAWQMHVAVCLDGRKDRPKHVDCHSKIK